MNELEKLLCKIPKKDRLRILETMRRIRDRDLSGLDRKKLSGYTSVYRVRVRGYRILYFDDGERVVFKAVRKRDESTYKNL